MNIDDCVVEEEGGIRDSEASGGFGNVNKRQVLNASGQNFVSARMSLASVAPIPVFAKDAADSLAGKPVSEATIQEASEKAIAAATPISDMRGTIRQRNHLVGVMTRRTLNIAVERARGG